MELPLEKRLKKRVHVELARLQDELVEMMYALDPKIILHGGTAVWRCYGGNRFSEDLDFYGKETDLAEFRKAFESRNLQVEKLKATGNLLFSKISDGRSIARIEINFAAKKEAIASAYEKTDGSTLEIFTLPIDELIREKLSAYSDRRRIRDIYDLLVLTGKQEKYPEDVQKQAKRMFDNIQSPIDEEDLQAIVFAGAAPSFRQMIDTIRRRLE